ncbi:hypothetical protein [Emticicia sp. SJ17W-69]|uniref:hypothetical protein n=1 Tax=Emticicia sp. SJ17W-69 TaxID=3421657 RepID=UPI003EBAA1B3
MKIVKEPKGVVFTVTGQGLNETEKSQLSEIIKNEKKESKKLNVSKQKELVFA